MELDIEIMSKAEKLYQDLCKKYKGDLASIYAFVSGEVVRLEYSAETPAQIRKSMVYSKCEEIIKELLVNQYMFDAGYSFVGDGCIIWDKKA